MLGMVKWSGFRRGALNWLCCQENWARAFSSQVWHHCGGSNKASKGEFMQAADPSNEGGAQQDLSVGLRTLARASIQCGLLLHPP